MTWHVPLREEVRATFAIDAPLAGYVIPPAVAEWLADRLRLHGIRFEKLESARAGLEGRGLRATRVELAKESFEGRVATTLQGAWRMEPHDVPAQSLFVPITQPNARLVMRCSSRRRRTRTRAGAIRDGVRAEGVRRGLRRRAIRARTPREGSALKAEFYRKLATDPNSRGTRRRGSTSSIATNRPGPELQPLSRVSGRPTALKESRHACRVTIPISALHDLDGPRDRPATGVPARRAGRDRVGGHRALVRLQRHVAARDHTSTTIITFLMVFLIQSTQNRDTAALQVKLSRPHRR